MRDKTLLKIYITIFIILILILLWLVFFVRIFVLEEQRPECLENETLYTKLGFNFGPYHSKPRYHCITPEEKCDWEKYKEIKGLSHGTGSCKAIFDGVYYNSKEKVCAVEISGGCESPYPFETVQECVDLCNPEFYNYSEECSNLNRTSCSENEKCKTLGSFGFRGCEIIPEKEKQDTYA